jgi:hypothetical protein
MMRSLRTLVSAAALAALGFMFAESSSAQAATTAGTQITNTATSSYSDGTNTYSSQSNTVTTTVQNAPSLTISPLQSSPGGTNVSPYQNVTSDTYTLTNTGNGNGYFQLPGTQGTNDGVTSGPATGTTYSVSGTAVGGATLTGTFANIAALNTYLSTGNAGGPFLTAPSSTITITALYAVNGTATAGQTITTLLTPDIIQPAGTGTTQQTSTTVIGQYTDTVIVDARIDQQKTAAVGGTVAAPVVTYTVRVANGGGRNVQPVFKNALPGGNAATYSGCANSTACGIVITDKLPSYNAVQLTLNGTPTVSGAGNVVIYSTDGTTWTTTSTGAVYVGVFVPAANLTGASLATFQPNNNTTSTNNVPSGNASLTLTFAINGSTASGAGNATAITNVVNSIYADNSGNIDGPGITPGSTTNNASAPIQTTPISNANGNLTGAGQVSSAADLTAASVLNGPNGFPGAIGPDTTTNTDYTAVSYTNGGTLLASVNGSTQSVPASAAAVTYTNSIQNTGNKFDTFTLSAATGTGLTALPAGWTVTFKSVGTALTANCPAVTSGTVITTLCVESGATLNYQTVYTPPAAATTFNAYTPYGDAITATSANNGASTNVTLDEFFVGGFVKLTKAYTVANNIPCTTAVGVPADFTAITTAVPGSCVQYVISYTNVAPTGGTNNVTLNASSFVITDNGTASGGTTVVYTNSWGTYTNGLYAAPVDTNGGTLGGYVPGPGAAGSTSFTDTIASLVAGASGTVTFYAQVK